MTEPTDLRAQPISVTFAPDSPVYALGHPPQKPLIKDAAGHWLVSGYSEAKALLLADTIQAGFGAEQMLAIRKYIPPSVAILDGTEHQQRRQQAAKLFTPAMVNNHHQALMESVADQIIDEFKNSQHNQIDFKVLSTQMASSVVCEIVGLTESIRPGIENRFLFVASNHDVGGLSLAPAKLFLFLKTQASVLNFWLSDIRPAIRARRKNPKTDLISHMISKGNGPLAILVECTAYGLAGVLTTREYMASVLELCMRYPNYRHLMLSQDQEARFRFLYEVLRLNPVTSHLVRRAVMDLKIDSDGQTIDIPAGDLIVFDIGAINLDPRAVGAEPNTIRTDRSYEARIMWSMCTFGAGAHRCPGETLAVLETDIFIQRFLALESLSVTNYPVRGFNDPSKTNELNNFLIQLDLAKQAMPT